MEVDVAHIMIPTRDGTRLAANIFQPVTDDKVPAVVEYTPDRRVTESSTPPRTG